MTRRRPPAPYVTYALIAVCAGHYCWQSSLDAGAGQRVVDALGAIPAVLLTDARLPPDLSWMPRYASPFTSMFLHASWMHLLGNMLFLWIYGDNVEDALGHARYALSMWPAASPPCSPRRSAEPHSAYPIIGASGAISGVLGAYLLLFPRARVLTLVLLPFFLTTLRVPAMLLLLLWFAVQLVSDLASRGRCGRRVSRAHRRLPGGHAARAVAQAARRAAIRQGVSLGARAPARAPGYVTVELRDRTFEGRHLVTPALGVQLQEERGPDHSIARLLRRVRRSSAAPCAARSTGRCSSRASSSFSIFGGLWQPSRLAYAVEQFFDNGGREALIVRVVNGARAATLTLRAGEAVLHPAGGAVPAPASSCAPASITTTSRRR